jgi:hypothetical protein
MAILGARLPAITSALGSASSVTRNWRTRSPPLNSAKFSREELTEIDKILACKEARSAA